MKKLLNVLQKLNNRRDRVILKYIAAQHTYYLFYN